MRALVLGLDCAAPALAFDRYAAALPTLSRLRRTSLWGTMRSCHPPITVPAWMVMASSQDPGRLGVYGFRHRKGNSYADGYTVSSFTIKAPTIWDYLGQRAKQVLVIGVPPSYPPKPVAGNLVSCFMTPGPERPFTFPEDLAGEITSRFGPYTFDVLFRNDDRDRILTEIQEMTTQHFTVLKYLLQHKPWDLAWFVEIGLDRIHHAFWKFFDPTHRKYEPGNRYERVGLDFYQLLDQQIAEVLALLDDETIVLVVSDHGAKGMRGAFCVNQWLAQEGYLTFSKTPAGPTSMDHVSIDWTQTKAWGWGGYYARIFLNVYGRERQGVIDPHQFEHERTHLAERLTTIRDPQGRVMNTKVYRPEDLYAIRAGDPPDLLVYFDDLAWRSAGTVGHPTPYLDENDTGPDDAVHDYDGLFILHDPRYPVEGCASLDILEVAPTLLNLLGEPTPSFMQGRPIHWP